MRVALFYHSLVSDWNHGNAHFLRGVAAELQARGHAVRIFEPEKSWSRENLVRDHGLAAIRAFQHAFPQLTSTRYDLDRLQIDEWLDGVDLAIVHEWNDPKLVSSIASYRRMNSSVRILFHDTHHRALTAEEELARFDLRDYDGVLAYGASLRDAYLRRGWGRQVHVWHEAADIRTFYPGERAAPSGDIVWIGNWGDEERSEELREYFLEPVKRAGWKAQVYGVRYPEPALEALAGAGIDYRGWLPNFAVPEVFARFKATVHVPRRPYVRELPGIPTIRPFEALACGIPLVSAPWHDAENLFRIGDDFLMAHNGDQMQKHLHAVLNDESLAQSLAASGLEMIRKQHTCAHRVDELLRIFETIRPASIPAEARFTAEARA
ncbi:MAG: glycosyltransferase [Acidobacteriaceae bacterium]|nr:glycosyltransferase [Acidobacteriaceae bacterium]